jgi:hypothetical protein
MAYNIVADPDAVGSGPFWSDSDPDVWDRILIRFRIRILALRNEPILTFLVCVKSLLFHFLDHEHTCTFKSIFSSKKFPAKSWPKIYVGQDPEPDPDVFESRIRIRSRSKIVRIRNTGLQYTVISMNIP